MEAYVTCVNVDGFETYLTKGKTYKLLSESDKFYTLEEDDNGRSTGWSKSRFRGPVIKQEDTGATKADQSKPQLSLIPRSAMEAEARVLGFGAEKYGRNNWRQGMKWTRVIDAAMRHLQAIADGEDRDPETGELHAAHLRCNTAFLIEYMTKGLGEDDRHTYKKEAA